MIDAEQFRIQLVNAVRSRPCLYNNNLQNYWRRYVVRHAWVEVGLELNVDSTFCKTRWRKLRQNYANAIHLRATGNTRKPYYLEDIMSFMLPFIRNRNVNRNGSAGRPQNDPRSSKSLLKRPNNEDTENGCVTIKGEVSRLQQQQHSSQLPLAENDMEQKEVRLFERQVLHIVDNISETREQTSQRVINPVRLFSENYPAATRLQYSPDGNESYFLFPRNFGQFLNGVKKALMRTFRLN